MIDKSFVCKCNEVWIFYLCFIFVSYDRNYIQDQFSWLQDTENHLHSNKYIQMINNHMTVHKVIINNITNTLKYIAFELIHVILGPVSI